MGLLSYLNQLTNGTTADASHVMSNFNAVASVVNGSIDSTNIASGGVGPDELATDAVTNAKIATGAVTSAELATLPRARVNHDVAQSIPSGVITTLAFNTEEWDTDAIHTSGDNTKLTCKTAGLYVISASVEWAPVTGTSRRQLAIKRSAGQNIAVQDVPVTVASVGVAMTVTTPYVLAVGDYVQATVYQNSGSALNIQSANFYSPEFSMTFISP